MSSLKALPLIFIGVVIILASYDLDNRIWQENDVVQRVDIAKDLEPIDKAGLSQEQQAVLEVLYEKYSELEKETLNGGMLVSDVVSSPTSLLLNEHILELKAIVALSNENGRGTTYFCLIKNTNIQSNISEVVKIMNNQKIHGYRLRVIDNVSVKLIFEDDASNTLNKDKSLTELVLIMYKKNDNVSSGKNNEK